MVQIGLWLARISSFAVKLTGTGGTVVTHVTLRACCCGADVNYANCTPFAAALSTDLALRWYRHLPGRVESAGSWFVQSQGTWMDSQRLTLRIIRKKMFLCESSLTRVSSNDQLESNSYDLLSSQQNFKNPSSLTIEGIKCSQNNEDLRHRTVSFRSISQYIRF